VEENMNWFEVLVCVLGVLLFIAIATGYHDWYE
jgi:hypothetical protein